MTCSRDSLRLTRHANRARAVAVQGEKTAVYGWLRCRGTARRGMDVVVVAVAGDEPLARFYAPLARHQTARRPGGRQVGTVWTAPPHSAYVPAEPAACAQEDMGRQTQAWLEEPLASLCAKLEQMAVQPMLRGLHHQCEPSATILVAYGSMRGLLWTTFAQGERWSARIELMEGRGFQVYNARRRYRMIVADDYSGVTTLTLPPHAHCGGRATGASPSHAASWS